MTPPELEGLPDLPDAATHVWNWFNDIRQGVATPAITWSDVSDWSHLRRITPLQWELDCLFAIDIIFREVFLKPK